MRNLPRTHSPRRGIYLISTLLLLTFLVIIGGAVMVSFSQGLSASTSFNNRQLALQAAMSGLAYVQARLESNVRSFAPQPDGTSAALVSGQADAPFQVTEQGWRVAGLVSSAGLVGGSASPVRMMFRASFTSSYTGCTASNDWTFVRDWSASLPPLPQFSVNNLTRTAASSTSSYQASGSAFQVVPGGMADIIVEGIALGPGGSVLARRTVEAMWKVDHLGGLAGGASSAGAMSLELGVSGGQLTVQTTDPSSPLAANSGLACLSDITLTGVDPAAAGATSPPGYSSSARASLPSLVSQRFQYRQGGATTDFTSELCQENVVKPPAVTVSQLPGVRDDHQTVTAGTWVVWNGMLYHYPTDYQATNSDGTPKALTDQAWTQPDSTKPPVYNGVSTDTPNGARALDGSSGTLTLDTSSNTVAVTGKDVLVAPTSQASSFALVVAPSQHSNGTIASPNVDSSTVGSAQLSFSQGDSTVTPQLRSSGSITVVGNVTGLGSMVTTGDAGGLTVPGNITVVGKSSLDTRSDSGVALYAAGDLSFWQLSQAQAPSAVPEVGTAFTNAGITPGSGSTGGSNTGITDLRAACDCALGQAMAGYIQAHPEKSVSSPGTSPGVYFNTTTNKYQVAYTSSGEVPADQIKDQAVTVSYGGTTYSGQLKKVLYQMINGGASGEYSKLVIARLIGPPVNGYTPSGIPANVAAIAPLASDSPWTWDTGSLCSAFVASNIMDKYVATGTCTGSPSGTPTPTPTATSTTSPGTGTGTATGAALDQSFNGLVYAQRNITMQNRLGSLRINGAMAAYGGNPSRDEPGAGGGGTVNLLANSIIITYNPAVLGPFAAFLGGQVGLKRTFVTVY